MNKVTSTSKGLCLPTYNPVTSSSTFYFMMKREKRREEVGRGEKRVEEVPGCRGVVWKGPV